MITRIKYLWSITPGAVCFVAYGFLSFLLMLVAGRYGGTWAPFIAPLVWLLSILAIMHVCVRFDTSR